MRTRTEHPRAAAARLGVVLALLATGGCAGMQAGEAEVPDASRTAAATPVQPAETAVRTRRAADGRSVPPAQSPGLQAKTAAEPAAPVERPVAAAPLPESAPKPQPAPAPKASLPPSPVADKDEEAVPPVSVAKPAVPAAKPVPEDRSDPVPAPKPAAPAAKPAPGAKPAPAPAPKPPALDLVTLEKRLKETSAIGLMTKLALKNQVDELLDRFRAHYDGRVKTTVAQLRQPYDMLILKVLSLLQDGDPSLASAIADSREAIWGILTDPGRFRNL